MRLKTLNHYIFFILSFFYSFNVQAENVASLVSDGIKFSLSTTQFVYEPQDSITITYSVENQKYFGVQIPFRDNARVFVQVEKSGLLSYKIPNVVTFIPGHVFIDNKDVFQKKIVINLHELRTVDNDSPLHISDGDIIRIHGILASDRFGIGVAEETTFEKFLKWNQSKDSKISETRYNPELDLNGDGIINYVDLILFFDLKYVISEWREISQTQLSIPILIHFKTADINRDGAINMTDFDLFIHSLNSTINQSAYDPKADFDGNGVINFTDFIEFVHRYQN